jgi:DNA-binding NtrC family response regulator
MDRKVLVADVPQVRARVAAALAQERVAFTHTLAAALEALAAEDFDLLLIGLRFDDSRMFDLVREVRAGSRNRTVPIVCFRMRPFAFSISMQVIEVTVKALGAGAFADLASYGSEQEGNAALARLVAAATGSG